MKKVFAFLMIVMIAILLQSCYSFTGASIPADVKTIRIDFFQNRAPIVNTTLSTDFTDGLRSFILSRASLREVDDDPDVEISGEITGYSIVPIAIQSDAKAALNKLTVTIRVNYVSYRNNKDNFSRTFSQFQEFSADLDISAVEADLCTTIVKDLVEDIFNAAFSNW